MKKGDYIYYRNVCGDSIPAIILKVCKKTLKIDGDFISENNIRYVKKINCTLQSEG